MLVDDTNTLPYENPMEKFKCFFEYQDDEIEYDNKETELRQPRKKNYPLYFFGF